jgi:hypothetical protein
LKAYDDCLPSYVHGGVTGEYIKSSGFKMPKCTQSAALSLIDGKKGRWLLRLDLKSFFEQVTQENVIKLFMEDFKCSPRIAWIVGNLCCVRKGAKEKNSETKEKILARGFATSGRLAAWCNLLFFKNLELLIKKELKDHSPLFAIFVDDIGISAVNVTKLQLKQLAQKIIDLAKLHGLIVHPVDSEKTEIIPPQKVKEHLGLRLTRKKIFPSIKTTRKKVAKLKQVKKASSSKEKEKAQRSLFGLKNNRDFTRRVSNA